MGSVASVVVQYTPPGNMGSSNGKPVLRPGDISALAKSSGLDEDQVKQAFDSFIAEHPDGHMKPKDFRETMQKALPKKDASKMKKHVFRIYDSNNDGYIDFTEFMLIYFIMSEGTPEEVLTKIFRVFDVNSDGTITQKEMNKLIKDMYGLLKTKDPKIQTYLPKTVFAEMDNNQDGKVTTDEFVAACMEHEGFSKMLALKIIDIFMDEN